MTEKLTLTFETEEGAKTASFVEAKRSLASDDSCNEWILDTLHNMGFISLTRKRARKEK